MQLVGWFVLFGAVVLTLRNGDFSWVSDWTTSPWLLLFALGFPTLLVLLSNNDRPIASGAHWLYFKRTWIKIYEIDSVSLSRGLTAYDLVLTEGGKKVSIRVDNLQENPGLWALVYNGIRHSVANGAEVTEEPESKLDTRAALHL